MQHHSYRKRAAKDKISSSLTGALTRIRRKIVNLPSDILTISPRPTGGGPKPTFETWSASVAAEGHRRREEQSGGVVPVFSAIEINFVGKLGGETASPLRFIVDIYSNDLARTWWCRTKI
jgi:hypothetical protein